MKPYLLLALILLLTIGVVSADMSVIYSTNETASDPLRNTPANGTFTSFRDGAGTGSASTVNTLYVRLRFGKGTNGYTDMYRTALLYDTSIIPDSATVNSAALNLKSTTVVNSGSLYGVGVTNFTGTATESSGNYVQFQNTRYATDNPFVAAPSWWTWNINSLGLSNISKVGKTGYMLRLGEDIDNTTPTWVYDANSIVIFKSPNTMADIPYLTVTWTPDTTPPASITNLANNTALCSEITWTWTNPTDTDYAYLHVLKNGVWTGNYSNSTSSSTWLTLNPLTSYEFASRTVDLDGNMNTTFVNRTATTPVCPVTPITSFTSNVTCGNLPTVAVQFNDTSNPNGYAITGYNWTFGDGNTSTLQNPVNTYYAAGAYWVNHSAGNVAGATWSNVSRYMIVVPDWGTCVPVSSGNTYYISNSQETPLPLIIPILAILLLALYVRRK